MQKILKNFLLIVIAIMVLVMVAGVYRFNFTDGGDIILDTSKNDAKNISYVIDGQTFMLVNGKAEKEIAPGSVSKQKISMFGDPVYGDFNGDGVKDAAVMLVSDGGGSGSFFYAVLAISTGTTFVSTNALLLGDRIAPQNINIEDGRAVYNYAERKAGEPMTTQPSIGKSLYVQYDKRTGTIGEFVKDFEGEADVNKMNLGMKKWNWVKTQMNDGKVVTPKVEGKFTLTFNKDGKVSVGTDCNSMGGIYKVGEDKKIVFDQMMSTKMYCEGSQEQEFASALNEVGSYMFTSKGELILEIKMDSGSMIFR